MRCWLGALAIAGLAVATTGRAAAQNALRGKRLYLDTARYAATSVSCVDCHGGLPGGSMGIGDAANDPAHVERAIATIPPMAPFRGRLVATDFVDLAAYIGNPGIASPDPRVTTRGPSGDPGPADRIAFGTLAAEEIVEAVVELRNAGMVAFAITAAPELSGPDRAQFSITATDCTGGRRLEPSQSCRIAVAFAPTGPAGDRTARVTVAHDWVRGSAAVALLGSVRTDADVDPGGTPGARDEGGCAVARDDAAPWLVVVLSLVARTRRSALPARIVLPARGPRRCARARRIALPVRRARRRALFGA